jgi:type IV secretory pathway VirB10-like protein
VEKTPEELEALSPEERDRYRKDLRNYRDYKRKEALQMAALTTLTTSTTSATSVVAAPKKKAAKTSTASTTTIPVPASSNKPKKNPTPPAEIVPPASPSPSSGTNDDEDVEEEEEEAAANLQNVGTSSVGQMAEDNNDDNDNDDDDHEAAEENNNDNDNADDEEDEEDLLTSIYAENPPSAFRFSDDSRLSAEAFLTSDDSNSNRSPGNSKTAMPNPRTQKWSEIASSFAKFSHPKWPQKEGLFIRSVDKLVVEVFTATNASSGKKELDFKICGFYNSLLNDIVQSTVFHAVTSSSSSSSSVRPTASNR